MLTCQPAWLAPVCPRDPAGISYPTVRIAITLLTICVLLASRFVPLAESRAPPHRLGAAQVPQPTRRTLRDGCV